MYIYPINMQLTMITITMARKKFFIVMKLMKKGNYKNNNLIMLIMF